MGFKKVYGSLQEIFPEVDCRLLRAVAIEHPKDAGSAVEVVLTEIIPFLTETAGSSNQTTTAELTPGSSSGSTIAEQTTSSSSRSSTVVQSLESEGTIVTPYKEDKHLQTSAFPDEEQHAQFYDAESGHDQLFHDADAGVHQIYENSSPVKLMSTKNYEETTSTVCANVSSPVPTAVLLHGDGLEADCKICRDPKEDAITPEIYRENSVEVLSKQQTQTTSSSLDQSINNSHAESINRKNYQENNCIDEEVVIMENSLDHVPLSGSRTSKLSSSQCGFKSVDNPNILNSDSMKETNDSAASSTLDQSIDSMKETNDSAASSSLDQSINNSHVESINRKSYQDSNCIDEEVVMMENSLDHVPLSGSRTSKLSSSQCDSKSVGNPDILNSDSMKETNDSAADASKMESPNELVDVVGYSTFTTGVTPSAQVCSFDLLEDIIADARNNKKILFSAMESVISFMKEVELREKAAEKAKQEAAEGSLEVLKRTEELKQMLQHAKEANDMHAGEVYGEKAILATEVRELQSRLLFLSEERDKSLVILDEMRQSLEVRLAAAENEIEAAKREKLGKEEIGRKLLADQEKIMEKVVQEANILKQEAEENEKLQEFLLDRGHVVDILQGEISVICQDVRLLKEKFDERLPLSKSLTSSQTSCILASSSSSLKSMSPEQVDPVTDQTDSSETAEKTDPVPSFIKPESFGSQTATDGDEASIDEEWEIFDNREAYI